MGMAIKIGAEVVAAALLLPVQVVSALVPSVAMPSVTIAGVPVTDLLLLTAGGILALGLLAESCRLHQAARCPVILFSIYLLIYSMFRLDYAQAGQRTVLAGLGTFMLSVTFPPESGPGET